jgi:hypothetical protein
MPPVLALCHRSPNDNDNRPKQDGCSISDQASITHLSAENGSFPGGGSIERPVSIYQD